MRTTILALPVLVVVLTAPALVGESPQEPGSSTLDKAMTKEQQEKTGVSKLSAAERAALGQWLNEFGLQAFVDATRVARGRPNNIYHYQLKAAPPFLSEELAIEKARLTLAKEGYRPEQWRLTRADMPLIKAPDGTPDKFFCRFGYRPSEGRVYVTDGKQIRTAQVRLEGEWVICFLFFGL
jgi:hypothetical protein